jgi:hypothetical protein
MLSTVTDHLNCTGWGLGGKLCCAFPRFREIIKKLKNQSFIILKLKIFIK